MLRKLKYFDFMEGSERMLKVHHKNAVVSKSLEQKKYEYDSDCYKSLSKKQQEIYEVYFNEYLPLKEQSNQIRKLPKLTKITPGNVQRSRPPEDKGDLLKLPKITNIHSFNKFMDASSVGLDNIDSTSKFMEKLRQRPRNQSGRSRKHLLLPPIPVKKQNNAKKLASKRSSICSLFPDSIAETDDFSEPDEKRLQIIKSAVALTSQPPKTPEFAKRKKRYGKSLIMRLRRQSRILWEEELLARAGELTTKSLEKEEIAQISINETERIWRPSLTKNKIPNHVEEDEDDDDFSFHFVDRLSQPSFNSVVSEAQQTGISENSDIPVHDIDEDLYIPESSPDLFSVTSVCTGRSYSGSYSDLEEDESGSFYSSETDSYQS